MKRLLFILLFLSTVAHAQCKLPIRIGAKRTYATWSASDKSGVTISGGNLTYTGGGGQGAGRATIGKAAGKWYWEVTLSVVPNTNPMIGILTSTATLTVLVGSQTGGWGYKGAAWCVTAQTVHGGTGCTDMAVGQVFGFALDMGAGTCQIYLNNVAIGYTITGLTGTVYPACGSDVGFGSGTANFGATAFTYTPPSGYNSGVY